MKEHGWAENGCLGSETEKRQMQEKTGDAVSLGLDYACRISLRERVEAQRRRAAYEAVCAEQLRELEYLLEKNPEVARILDLVEIVKG